MKALAAIMIAAVAGLATTGITSAPLLDVERSDIASIVGATPSTTPAIARRPPPPADIVDTTVVDTTVVVDTSVVDTTVVVDTSVVDTTSAVDTTVSPGQSDCNAGGDSSTTTTVGC